MSAALAALQQRRASSSPDPQRLASDVAKFRSHTRSKRLTINKTLCSNSTFQDSPRLLFGLDSERPLKHDFNQLGGNDFFFFCAVIHC